MISTLIIRGCVFLVMILSIGIPTNAFQGSGSERRSDDWELCTICGVPARIALNSAPGPALVPRREIYLLMEASDFTEDSLRQGFERLSLAYPDPISLSIIVFSNKGFLLQLIKAEEANTIIDFADTPAGRDAEQKYYSQRYPPRKGYFRAYYVRRAVNDESFQYTPSVADEKTVEVILKRRTR
jgi:hypothetical protein